MNKLLILLIIPLFLTGCFSYNEINDLGIVSSLGIEKQNDEFLVTAQMINIQNKNENTNESKIINFYGKGNSLFEAIRNVTTTSSKKVYLPHLKILVISSQIIEKNNLNDIIDLLLRDAESMMNYYILVTDDYSPKEILETLTPLESTPSEYITNSLKNSEKFNGNTNMMTFEKLVSDLSTKGIEPIYTLISLTKNSNDKEESESLENSSLDSYIKLGNLLFLNYENKLIKLTKEESIMTNILRNNKSNLLLTIKCNETDNYFILEIIDSSSKIKISNNELLTINSSIKANVGEYKCKKSLEKSENIKELENISNKYLEQNLLNVLQIAQKNKTDFLGIGKTLHSENKNFFYKYQDNWNKLGLPILKFEINVKTSIEIQGNLETKKFHGEDNEK